MVAMLIGVATYRLPLPKDAPCTFVHSFVRAKRHSAGWLYIVADGTADSAKRLSRVLTNDPGTGVMRQVDAGYKEVIECAKDLGVKIPKL
jgi:hypothetical protein